MLLSAVSVLVVAQSSSEIPEGLMNNPVVSSTFPHTYCTHTFTQALHFSPLYHSWIFSHKVSFSTQSRFWYHRSDHQDYPLTSLCVTWYVYESFTGGGRGQLPPSSQQMWEVGSCRKFLPDKSDRLHTRTHNAWRTSNISRRVPNNKMMSLRRTQPPIQCEGHTCLQYRGLPSSPTHRYVMQCWLQALTQAMFDSWSHYTNSIYCELYSISH